MKYTIAASLALATALAAAPATADTLRFAHWVPPQHKLQETGIQPWLESIKEASGGQLDFQIFPAQQLGSATDHYDMTRDGIADLAYVNPGYQPGRFPVIALGEIPLQVTNGVAASGAFDRWYRPYAEKEMADTHFCFAFLQDPGTIHSTREVKVPADLKGMNVRPAQATIGKFVHLLGGSSVQVPAPEAREVLARGAADAIFFPWDSILLFGIENATKFHLDAPLYTTTFVITMNKAKYDGLTPELKTVVDNHCTSEWAEKFARGWAEQERAGIEKMRALPGHTLYKPTDAELAEWKAAAAPLVDEWKAAVNGAGWNADEVQAGFVAEMEKADSLLK